MDPNHSLSSVKSVNHCGEASFIIPTDGKGVGILGKILSIWNTLCDLLHGIGNHEDIMQNQGRVLNGTRVQNFLTHLKAGNQIFEYVNDYIHGDFIGNQATIDRILNKVKDFYRNSSQQKLAIPLVLPPLHWLEEKHMVTIFIDKDSNTIDYFDPKGVTSKYRQLESGKNMNTNVIAPLCQKIQDVAGKPIAQINENANVIQLNCHHCGAYSSWFVEQRLKGLSADKLMKEGISLSAIHLFRKEMKQKQTQDSSMMLTVGQDQAVDLDGENEIDQEFG